MYCDLWRKSAEFPQEPRLLRARLQYVPVGWNDYAGCEKARGTNFVSEEQLFFPGGKTILLWETQFL